MSAFSEALFDELENLKIPFQNICVILPTQRSGLELKRTIARRTEHTSWTPEITTINQWAGKISGLQSANHIELAGAFYKAYQKVMGAHAQSLDAVVGWCDTLIKDFNTIDSHGLKNADVFKDLVAYTDIEHFSFLDEPLSESQSKYRSFWMSLKEIHDIFKEDLKSKKLGYSGLIVSSCLEKLDSVIASSSTFYVFAGLNALSGCEQEIIKRLVKENRALCLFEGDPYYLDTNNHHAGTFIRSYLKKGIGKALTPKKGLLEKELKIDVYQTDFNLQQAAIVGHLLEILPSDSLKKTALVLSDESLLTPVLSYIPKEIEANITMGVSIADSAVAYWIELLFDLAKRTALTDGKILVKLDAWNEFVDNQVTRLLMPYVSQNIPPNGYMSIETLRESLESSDWELIFDWLKSEGKGRVESLAKVFAKLGAQAGKAENKLLEIQIRKVSEELRIGLAQMKADGFDLMDLDGLKKIVFQWIRNIKVDLIGSHIDQLQIMGMLESRGLSFEHVIITSVNEGVLPPKPNFESFIPYEILNHHRLPGKRERESVFSYYFYRLIQNAKKLSLVYHTNREGISGGEMSRYISQLQYNLKELNPNLHIKWFSPAVSDNSPSVESVVEKDNVIFDQIKRHIEERLSASSINRFHEDPLEWYYTSVMKLDEPKIAEVSNATYGSVVHDALEELYKPLVKEKVTHEHLIKLKLRIGDELDNAIVKNEDWIGSPFGLNAVLRQKAFEMISKFIDSEMDYVQTQGAFDFIDAEIKMQAPFEVQLNDLTIRANLFGIADRVEGHENGLMVIDYKTGNVYPKDINGEIDHKTLSEHPKLAQLMLYQWLAKKHYTRKIKGASIISMPKPYDRSLLTEHSIEDQEICKAYESFLTETIRAMLNTAEKLEKSESFEYAKFEK